MNIDFDKIDQLAQNKTFEMLTTEERELVLSQFENETEYTQYREFMSITTEAISSDSPIEADPGIELRVIEHMKLTGGKQRDVQQNSMFGFLTGLFASHSLGFKTSFAMVGLITTIFFSSNPSKQYIYEGGTDETLIADSSMDRYQDSNIYQADSSYIKKSF